MDNFSEYVSDSLTGNKREVVVMNEKYYTLKPPKTKLLAKMLKPLSHLQVGEFKDKSDVPVLLKRSTEQYHYADEFIALCILGDNVFGWFSRVRLWRLKRLLSFASDAERYDAINKIVNLIIPSYFFAYCRLAMELTGAMATKQES